ncbi:MAG: hypothetical protein DI535_02060 [Citrobacter freundii]|nr:MAG: hypothetical protein DI535_02060 [Citrobacter freundii]
MGTWYPTGSGQSPHDPLICNFAISLQNLVKTLIASIIPVLLDQSAYKYPPSPKQDHGKKTFLTGKIMIANSNKECKTEDIKDCNSYGSNL